MEENADFLIFRDDGRFVSAYTDPLQAACMVAMLGAGTSIRDGTFENEALWREGSESQAADDDFEYVANTVMQRRLARRASESLEAPPSLPFN